MISSTTSLSEPVAQAFDLPRQGTPEWLELRRSKIGGSDVPILMGENDFSTPYEIWRIKTGRAKEKEVNLAMMRGVEAEAKIRALYELHTGFDVPACIVQGQGIPWAMVSLDGYDEASGLVVEFKYPGRETHEEARQGRVPLKYYGQVQYQLAVTGAKRAHYVSYQEDPETKEPSLEIVAVTPDTAYWAKMFPVLEAFWEHVKNDTPPPLCERDFKVLEDERNQDVFGRWKVAKLMTIQLEEVLDQLKARMKEETDKLEKSRAEIEEIVRSTHPKVRCNGVKVITAMRKNGPSLDVRLDEGFHERTPNGG